MGCLPIRDTASRSFPVSPLGLPDVRDHFAADACLACVTVGHHAVRRRDDRDTETPQDTGKLVLLGIDAQSGLADAAQTGDGPLLARAVLQTLSLIHI